MNIIKRRYSVVYSLHTHTHKINENLQNNAWPSTANMEKFTSPLLQKTEYHPNNHLFRERKNESVDLYRSHTSLQHRKGSLTAITKSTIAAYTLGL